MLDAYMQLPFDNPDGGVWKQGFDIKYDKQKIRQEKKLEVIVVPHSHMDPGWLKTFEEYYDTQSRKILTGMLQYLEAKPDIKFICAEMSFFELWWSRLTETERDKTKRWVSNVIEPNRPYRSEKPNKNSFHLFKQIFSVFSGEASSRSLREDG